MVAASPSLHTVGQLLAKCNREIKEVHDPHKDILNLRDLGFPLCGVNSGLIPGLYNGCVNASRHRDARACASGGVPLWRNSTMRSRRTSSGFLRSRAARLERQAVNRAILPVRRFARRFWCCGVADRQRCQHAADDQQHGTHQHGNVESAGKRFWPLVVVARNARDAAAAAHRQQSRRRAPRRC